jgi:hypothetical protein
MLGRKPCLCQSWHDPATFVSSYVPLAENNVQDLISIVETNTLGTMLCCREVRLCHRHHAAWQNCTLRCH